MITASDRQTQRWLASKTVATRRVYAPEVAKFLRWLGGRPVSGAAINGYAAKLSAEGRTPNTVARIINTLCSRFGTQVSRTVVRVPQVITRPTRPLTKAKLLLVFRQLRSLNDRAWFRCAQCGVRIGEASELRPEDLQWTSGAVLLRLKTRQLLLEGEAYRALRRLYEDGGELRPFVFMSSRGNRMTPQAFTDILQNAGKRAGLKEPVYWGRLKASGIE